MIKTAGTVLLVVGFAMLVGAWEITNPLAKDANIGAGGLIFVGKPTGALGISLILVDFVLTVWRRRRSQTATE